MMILKKGDKTISTTLTRPDLEEGDYSAEIKNISMLKDIKTNWGFKEFLEIEYDVVVGITTQIKRERIMVSEAKGSRCRNFLESFYKGEIPKEVLLDEFLGKECVITIEHKTDSTGRIFANITERKFK